MTDVFYFSTNRLSTEDALSLLTEQGYSCSSHVYNGVEQLNVWLTARENVYWIRIEPLGEDFRSFEEPQQEAILKTEPISGFIISFYMRSLKEVIKMIKLVMESHQGWLGVDDNEFRDVYSLGTIDSLAIPE